MDLTFENIEEILRAIDRSPGNGNRWRQLMLKAFDQKDMEAFRTLQIIGDGLDKLLEARQEHARMSHDRAVEHNPDPTEERSPIPHLVEAALEDEEASIFSQFARNPQDARLLNLIGQLYQDWGLLTVAKAHFERAQQIDPEAGKSIVEDAGKPVRSMSLAVTQALGDRDTAAMLAAVAQHDPDATMQIRRAKPLSAESAQVSAKSIQGAQRAKARERLLKNSLVTANIESIGRQIQSLQDQAGQIESGAPEKKKPLLGSGQTTQQIKSKSAAFPGRRRSTTGELPRLSEPTGPLNIDVSADELIKRSVELVHDGKLDEATETCRLAIDKDASVPLGWHTWATIGVAYFEQGKVNQAIHAYEKALKLEPGALESWFNLGVAYFENGQPSEALRCYLRANVIDPDNPKINCNLGTVYFQNGQFEHAATCFRHAINRRPDYARAWDNLGAALGAQGKLGEAVEACRRALEFKPDFPEAYFKLGTIAFQQGRDREAEEAFAKVVESRPRFSPAYVYLTMIYARQHRIGEAAAACVKAEELEANPDLLWMACNDLGNAYLERGEATQAIAVYKRATELHPREPEPWTCLGHAYLKAGMSSDAEHAFFFGVQTDAASPEAWRGLARARFVQENYAGAADALRFAIEIEPNHCGLWCELSASLQMQKRDPEAISALENALRIEPGNLRALNSLGLLLTQLGHHDRAIATLRDAINHHPEEPEPWFYLGRTFKAADNPAAAADCFEHVVTLAPDFADAWQQLGTTSADAGNHARASEALRKAIHLMKTAA
jgi:tetratricopeptide (TPR) repeat protein